MINNLKHTQTNRKKYLWKIMHSDFCVICMICYESIIKQKVSEITQIYIILYYIVIVYKKPSIDFEWCNEDVPVY